ncbi:hypothetical protein [Olsenella massiliensis]|nr:hypothetical protein [Olsenella massiliensis]
MKTMTLSDLIIMRNYLAQQSVVGLYAASAAIAARLYEVREL